MGTYFPLCDCVTARNQKRYQPGYHHVVTASDHNWATCALVAAEKPQFSCLFCHVETQNEKEIDMQMMTQTKPETTIMNVQQAAGYLGLAVSTLNKWRCHGGGPVFVKMGRAVRYRLSDLDQFIADMTKASTSC